MANKIDWNQVSAAAKASQDKEPLERVLGEILTEVSSEINRNEYSASHDYLWERVIRAGRKIGDARCEQLHRLEVAEVRAPLPFNFQA